MIFEEITLRNFYSIGNVTQAIPLNRKNLTLILGVNNDMGGMNYRNSCGKTSVIQAIFYALYGEPITKIKIDNLINKDNKKDMLVTLTFSVGKNRYKIERGRKPNVLSLYKDGKDINDAHGEKKDTQEEINKIIKMSSKLCKQIRILTTKNAPFLSMTDKDQRDIIEELFGIDILSQKAEKLKKLIKDTKDAIKEEETRLVTLKQINTKIANQITELEYKNKNWEVKNKKEIEELSEILEDLKIINIDEELKKHKTKDEYVALKKELKDIDVFINNNISKIENNDSKIEKFILQNKKIKDNICPTCNQNLHTEMDNFDKDIFLLEEENKRLLEIVEEKEKSLISCEEKLNKIGIVETIYSSLEEVYEHKNTISLTEKELFNLKERVNPYYDQIINLRENALQEVNSDYFDELTLIKEHQDFLYKMLTNKDSPIRKRIIDQNLNILNESLKKYLNLIKLPHQVIFNNDLSVSIKNFGNEYDFDQLSNGEQNRIILSLAWSFQEVFEFLHGVTNLNIIDELVDSGMDGAGTDACVRILRNFVSEDNKTIFLISHKSELENKVDNVLYAIKEDGFTNYEDISY